MNTKDDIKSYLKLKIDKSHYHLQTKKEVLTNYIEIFKVNKS
jgi:hypothetical protein